MKGKSGFSLIEILIVIAIVSILAATAIPMYLEYQVRAKVAATLSDMQRTAFAVETYFIDHHAYIPSFTQFSLLTSPVAYLANVPRDSFPTQHLKVTAPRNVPKKEWDEMRWFEYFSSPKGLKQRRMNGAYNHYYQRVEITGDPLVDFQAGMDVESPAKWVIRSNGPDHLRNWYLAYDPSNGTVSPGDIARFGP